MSDVRMFKDFVRGEYERCMERQSKLDRTRDMLAIECEYGKQEVLVWMLRLLDHIAPPQPPSLPAPPPDPTISTRP